MSEISDIVLIALWLCLFVCDHFSSLLFISLHLLLFIWRTVPRLPTVVAQDFFLCFSRTPPSLSLLLVELMEEKDVLEEEGVNTRMMLEEEAEEDEEEVEEAEVVDDWSV